MFGPGYEHGGLSALYKEFWVRHVRGLGETNFKVSMAPFECIRLTSLGQHHEYSDYRRLIRTANNSSAYSTASSKAELRRAFLDLSGVHSDDLPARNLALCPKLGEHVCKAGNPESGVFSIQLPALAFLTQA